MKGIAYPVTTYRVVDLKANVARRHDARSAPSCPHMKLETRAGPDVARAAPPGRGRLARRARPGHRLETTAETRRTRPESHDQIAAVDRQHRAGDEARRVRDQEGDDAARRRPAFPSAPSVCAPGSGRRAPDPASRRAPSRCRSSPARCALTRMPSGAQATASDFVSCATPPFEAA